MDLDKEKTKAAKKRLLDICSKTLKLSEGSRDILRKVPVCNLRQIERQAKNLKDPSPLQTMMASISEKYPISIDAEKARLARVPSEFLGPKDTHRHGRIICKKEAITWFINESEPPGEGVRKAMDVLYQTQRRLYSDYSAWDWSMARINYGQQELRRETVRTNVPLMEVPRGERTNLLIAVLFPESVIHWENIDKGLLDKLKEFVYKISDAKVPILHTIRLVGSMMDPRERTIPISPSLPRSVHYFRHAFSSPIHLVKVFNRTRITPEDSEEVGDILGRVIAWRCDAGDDLQEIKQILARGRIRNVSGEMIARMTRKPGVFKDVVRSVFGLPNPVQFEIRNATFYPQKCRIVSKKMQNAANTYYFLYSGRETVHVRYQDMNIMFARDDSYLLYVKMPMGSGRILTEILARIAVFLKWQWHSSRKATIRGMTVETFNTVRDAPWTFLERMTGHKMKMAHYRRKSSTSENFSIIEFVSEFPNINAAMTKAELCWPYLRYETGMDLEIVKPLRLPVLPSGSSFTGMLLSDHYPPNDMLKCKALFYLQASNFKRMMDEASVSNFEWMNEGVREGVTGANKDRIHATARGLFQMNMYDNTTRDRRMLVLYYCFASNTDIVVARKNFLKQFQWYGSIDIDFVGVSGEYKIHNNELFVTGDNLATAEDLTKPGTLMQFVPGWSIIPKPGRKLPVVPFRHLYDKHHEGKMVAVQAYGTVYYLVKSIEGLERYKATIKRQCQAFEQMQHGLISKKRARELNYYVSSDEDEGEPSSKKPRDVVDLHASSSEGELDL